MGDDGMSEFEMMLFLNPNLRLLLECFEESFNEVVSELINDIMVLKSFSYGEARLIAYECMAKGISPKSDEFYSFVGDVKTMWEI